MADTLSSTVAKVSSAISGLYNSFLGQTRSQARLNAIASYDQSNELFKVCNLLLIIFEALAEWCDVNSHF
jgi:hypothetical protein